MKYNKAQEECINGWGKTIFTVPATSEKEGANVFRDFLEDFNSIDPAPDPETYCIWIKDSWHDYAKFPNLTKEQADRKLHMYMEGMFWNSVVEYKKGEYLVTLSGARYEVRKAAGENKTRASDGLGHRSLKS